MCWWSKSGKGQLRWTHIKACSISIGGPGIIFSHRVLGLEILTLISACQSKFYFRSDIVFSRAVLIWGQQPARHSNLVFNGWTQFLAQLLLKPPKSKIVWFSGQRPRFGCVSMWKHITPSESPCSVGLHSWGCSHVKCEWKMGHGKRASGQAGKRGLGAFTLHGYHESSKHGFTWLAKDC